jgi:hypothetical protein
MWAMAPNRKPFEPAGADVAEITRRFGGWEVSDAEEVEHRHSARGSAQGWYRLTRC